LSFIKKFNTALSLGIDNMQIVIDKFQPSCPDFNLKAYYTDYISYRFDAPKRRALELFLGYVSGKEIRPSLVYC